MNASRNPISRPNPAVAAAVATVISTLLLGSVVGLFASDSLSSSAAIAQKSPAHVAQQSGAARPAERLAANSTPTGRL